MARLTNVEIAERLSGDNRTVVCYPDQTNDGAKVVATDVGPVGATYGLGVAKTATSAAYRLNVTEGDAQDEIEVEAGLGATQGTLDKTSMRTQYFHTGNYDASQRGFGAKRCYVNINGQPLDANGAVTTVAAAIDAETTALTGRGEAVTNYAQVYQTDGNRTPVPGVYDGPTVLQTALYAPYPGYTAQHDLPAAP